MACLTVTDGGANVYTGQIIAIVEDSPVVQEAARYLSNKHPAESQVVKWLPKDPKDPAKGNSFKLVEWNEGIKQFQEVKIGRPPKAKPIEPLPKDGRIQVVGHGRKDPTTSKITMGELSPTELASAVKTLPRSPDQNAIKRISLVGCSVGELTDDGTTFVGDKFPETLLAKLKSVAVEVSSRNGIVGVDSTGRKVYGEQTSKGIVWRPKEGNIKKTVVYYDSKDNIQRKDEQFKISEYRKPRSLSRSFKPTGGRLELEEIPEAGATAATTEYVTMSNDDLFSVVDSATRDLFKKVSVPSGWDDQVEKERYVRVIDDKKAGTEKRMKLKIREFSSFDQITKEIKHWGEKGFEYPEYDKEAKIWKDTDRTGSTMSDKYVYYRYGDHVYSLKVQSGRRIGPVDIGGHGKGGMGLSSFYTTLVGVIENEDPTNPSESQKNTGMDLHTFGDAYGHFQRNTDQNFFSDTRQWLKGQHDTIGLTETNAINGKATIAMFICEAIRDYRVHLTNKLSLDLNSHAPAFDRNKFFSGHPLARGGAAPARDSGMRDELWAANSGNWKKFKGPAIKKFIGALVEQWAEAGYEDLPKRTRKRPASSAAKESTSPAKRLKLQEGFKESITKAFDADVTSGSNLIKDTIKIAGPLFEGPYDAREVEEPQTESVQSEVNEYQGAEDLSLPLRASHAMLRDQLYISKEIGENVKVEETGSGKTYEIDEESITVEGKKVTYQIYEPSDPSSRKTKETELDESKMTSKDVMDEMHKQAMGLQGEGIKGKINKGLAIYGTVMGIKGTVEAFERGDVTHGIINLGQTLHGIGELSGINRKIYKAAGKAVGRIASKAIGRVSEVVGTVLGENAGKLLAHEGGELLSTVGEVGELMEDIPIIGTAFGIYNIYEDLQQHTVIGYVDAGLDTLITELGLLGPEAEPFVIALTIIRMGIDSFYNDIKKELDSLPPGASTGQKVVAVLKGMGEAILDIYDTVTGGIWSAPFKAAKLDREYAKNQQFLGQVSDYHNYYKVSRCSGSAAINFAGAADSWNGGSINFALQEGGRRGHLKMTSTNQNGQEVHHSEYINFGIKVTDIVMGIGESHTVNFKEQSVKVLWVIPADKKKIISGLQGDRSSLHGEYYGNSDNNNFFAVQKLPKNMKYGLSDYHYVVKGNGGNDTFYFGPQHTYVEGNQGSDAYFLDGDSSHVTLNNFDSEGTEDFMVIPKTFKELSLSQSGNDVIITSGSVFKVTIKNWFSASSYQHLVFKTSDRVSFRIEKRSGRIRGVPYALSGAGSKKFVRFNPALSGYHEVTELIGSDHDDYLYGNDKNNVFVPGKGEDFMQGNNGADTYNMQFAEGDDTIDNGASDGQMDTIIFPANANVINVQRSTSSLIISTGGYQLSVQKWFNGEYYQHVMIYTKDHIIMEIRHDATANTVRLVPTLLELVAPQNSVNLMTNSILRQITSVVGNNNPNTIRSNNLNNYLTGGGGKDVLTGGEGMDTYVVKKSTHTRKRRGAHYVKEVSMLTFDGSVNPDNFPFSQTFPYSPSHVEKRYASQSSQTDISNYALDKRDDLLLYGTTFADISLHTEGQNLRLTSKTSLELNTVLKDWFMGPYYQHLIVRSQDGIAFTLPLNTTFAKKTALVIDKSKSKTPTTINLLGSDFLTVKRVIGSPQRDDITGNHIDNYIDPRAGGGSMRGNNGSDTYVLKPGYGHYDIYNEAMDNVADTLLFNVTYSQISVTKDAHSVTLRYTDSVDSTKSFSARLMSYVTNKEARHLTIVSSDGITFVISPVDSFTPVIIAINKVSQYEASGQPIHLGTTQEFSEVRTVYGTKFHANNITGNDKRNTIVGGDRDDFLSGGDGNDILKGGGGNNYLIGGPGNDTLSGGSGNDVLDGGPGNDILSPGGGDNFIDGGDGDDTLLYAGEPFNETGIYMDLNSGFCQHGYGHDEIHQVENVYGTPYNDAMISAGFADNVLNGREGNDTLIAYDGYDILIGGEGKDVYNLVEASGTKVIMNYARDRVMDSIDLSFVASKKMRFERHADDLIIRLVSSFYANPGAQSFPSCNDTIPRVVVLHPPSRNVTFCETYNPLSPTVILKDWFKGEDHRHLVIAASDCTLDGDFLRGQPVSVICNILGSRPTVPP